MKDASPDNFIPALSHVGNMVTLTTVLFLLFLLFIFWIASLGSTKQANPQSLNLSAEGQLG
jgi:hypothetical protein